MSSAAILEADFGSESEDDNFNPAPADDSEIEEVGDMNDEVGLKSEEKGVDQKQAASGNIDTKNAPQRDLYLGAEEKAQDGQDDSDQENGNAAGGDDEDEEDPEDDDDDDEDDEPVHNSH